MSDYDIAKRCINCGYSDAENWCIVRVEDRGVFDENTCKRWWYWRAEISGVLENDRVTYAFWRK